jgi:hypothetical protein
LEGLSFAPLLDDRARPWKTAAFSQFLREGKWVAPDGVEYMGYSIRTKRHRYVEWVRWDTKELAARELYDQQSDSGENTNLAAQPEYREIMQVLSQRLQAGWRAALP